MNIRRLHLKNFRSFETLDITFDEKLTVIVANNGMGKTTILDAIAIGLTKIVGRMPSNKGVLLKTSDIRIDSENKQAPYARYFIEADTHDGWQLQWSDAKKRDNAVSIDKDLDDTEIGVVKVSDYVRHLIESINSDEKSILPMMAYYGTNRAIIDDLRPKIVNTERKFDRFESLQSGLNVKLRFGYLFEWLVRMEDKQRRVREAKRDFDYQLPELALLDEAIQKVLPGFSHLRSELVDNELTFVIDRIEGNQRRSLQTMQLSDGYRTTLALVADLARRMIQANPFSYALGNTLDLPGVVMIDEIDLHLHPQWQQVILQQLQQAFPNIQFIVTTHSPQVLSCVDSSCIRILQETEVEGKKAIKAVTPDNFQTKGVASSDILAQIMGVNPIPEIEEAKWVVAYHGLIQQSLHESDEGTALRAKLLHHFSSEHPVMLECDRMIRLQAFKQRLPVPNREASGA